MHFADAGLLDFIDHLLDCSRGLPIYVVTLARPDLIERRQDWGAGKRNFVSLYLEPLSEADMRELLAGLVPGLPETAVATIVARADGIPLYAVETVRTLVADGRLVEEDGVYVPNGDLSNARRAGDADRADRLATRRARRDRPAHRPRRAPCWARASRSSALGAVVEMPQEDLEPRLAALVRRELLRREMDPRSPERGQYAFVQALIREVAYNTLSKKDRKKLHLAAARYFESLGSDEIAGALASHYLAAHANSAEGAEADALAGQARIALKAAAMRASALGTFDQAVHFLEQALTVTSDASEEADLLEQAAFASRTSGRYEHAEQLQRKAVELRRSLPDRVALLKSIAELGYIVGQQFKLDEATELLEAAQREFSDLVDEPAMADVKVMLARALQANNESGGLSSLWTSHSRPLRWRTTSPSSRGACS